MQKAIVKMLTAIFSLFKSEKDRPDNYAQLARGNGGEHDQINKRDIQPLVQVESEVLHFGGQMPRSSQIANFMPWFSDQGFFLELSTEIRTNIIQKFGYRTIKK